MHASGVSVRDGEGRLIAALPEIAFELSSSAMLSGTLAPSEIEIIAPRIRLQRDREGRISLGGETAAPLEDGRGDRAPDGILRELRAERRPGNALTSPDQVRHRDRPVLMRDPTEDAPVGTVGGST